MDPSETPEMAALREFLEERFVHVEVEAVIIPSDRPLCDGNHVHYVFDSDQQEGQP